MSSRKNSDTTSLSGVNYSANTDRADTMVQKNVFVSGGVTSSPGLAGLVGRTIRGQVVGSVERWADGTIWDTSNNRPLTPGIDFDATLLQRGWY